MYRYITLLWNRADRESAQAADYVAACLHKVSPHTWRKAWEVQGIAVHDSGEHKGRMQSYRLAGGGGVILGRLFRNDYTSQIEDLGADESSACLNTKGQHLVDNYWGRYVAFLNDPASGARYVMRDPSGAFPCFHTFFRGVEIYFSDMQDAANFEFLRFTVNWAYLKTNIMLPQFQKIHTGLNEVGDVLPAECVEITPFERKSRFVWDPTKISKTAIVEDPEEAATLLRTTVKKTVGALAGCYDRVLHNLGGFDSSIVLASLADAARRPDITCINFFTKSPSGEERFYSRQAANRFGVPLAERELDYRKADLSKIFKSNKLANPLGFFDCIGLTGDVLALAKEKQAQALFYGVGGDQVFYQPPFNLGALDYVRRHGIGKDSLRIAIEASRYGRKSLIRTFRDMARECIAPAPCYNYVHQLFFEELKIPLVNPDFVGAGGHERFLHPLLIPNDRDLKSKYVHILCCALFSLEYYDHLDTEYYAPRVRAYLTQPIIETCLRIPTWIMSLGGVNRGLARKAFLSDLPSDIVRRSSKSTPGGYYNEIYDHNIDFLREYLLDGVMVREGILLRDKLEAALTKKDLFLNVIKFQMLSYLATETWLRGWTARPINQARNIEIAM